MTPDAIAACADELYRALRERRTVQPLTQRQPELTITDAYHISRHMLEKRLADGERLIGKKIGVTSRAVQTMLGVHQPDFGYLTDAMQFKNGAEVPISQRLIQPRAEGELAFVLKSDLKGPGVCVEQVIDATERVLPCFEIVDSRISDWKIAIQDTVADNASSGLFVLGGPGVAPRELDLLTVGMAVYKNSELISTGAGAAALGNPAQAVAWLANTLGGFDISLLAGEVILSGSLVPLEPVVAGDSMRLLVGSGVGSAEVVFT